MNFLLPIAVLTVPILVIVSIAVYGGRRLAGSCGGVGPDGRCARCGAAGPEIDRRRTEADGRSCP